MADAQDQQSNIPEMQSLLQDEACRLESRGVIALSGEVSTEILFEVLQPLVCNSLAQAALKPVLTHIVDSDGVIVADMFVVCHENSLLLECSIALLPDILAILMPRGESLGVSVADVSDQWRVFAELPDQNTYDDGSFFIKYADPRWHMGARIMRSAALPVSYSWGSELKWMGHAFKLGYLPSADLLHVYSRSDNVNDKASVKLTVAEVGLHSLGLVDIECMPTPLQSLLADPKEYLKRRMLPLRLEPLGFSFPSMAGLALMAGEAEIGTVIAHQGLYGLALVELAPWRKALAAAKDVHCADQHVLITWPSWLAQESLGRGGPVALAEAR